MGLVAVLVAALASWLFGAAWYMALSKRWVEAAGIELDDRGRPKGGSPLPFMLSAVAMVIVAAMTRHVFLSSGIATLGAGLVGGLGIGLFFVSPWIMINNAYGMRPFRLTLIDGGYATFGCGIIGAVLTLFD